MLTRLDDLEADSQTASSSGVNPCDVKEHVKVLVESGAFVAFRTVDVGSVVIGH